jgi:molybdopterin-binding protein
MLEVNNISLTAGEFSLKSVTFRVSKGEYFVLLGVSGAGKSVLLETIAGLIIPDSGSIILEGIDITREKIQNRGTGLVFQDHAIFPHMSVKENIGYALHGRHMGHAEKMDRIVKIAEKMNISGLLQRRPVTLSGGELQRIALARTLIQEPGILLLDEPLASMDIQLRAGLRSLLRTLNRQGQTIIHVTHDYEEALSLASRIAVIHNGRILQEGTPEEVFRNPRSEFVAHFTGARNFFRTHILSDGHQVIASVTDQIRFILASDPEDTEGFVMLRSEDIVLSVKAPETSAVNVFHGIVKEVVPTRSGVEVIIDIGIPVQSLVTTQSVQTLKISEGSPIWLSFKASAVRFVAV